MTDLVGKTLRDRYRVDASVGRGGMAEVYKVWDAYRGTYLAMKLLHADLAQDPVFLRRFRREAQNLSKLQHPNIVRLYGLEQDDLLAFMLMDYVEGTTLRAEILRLKGRPMPLERIRQVMQPICAALHYAHRQNIVHCDVKPANVMIDKSGRILLADFGIARMAEGATTVTMVGAGTPAYMAPEQVRGENPSPQTDIYALGIILYEMLTGGERPFTGELATITGSTSEKVRWEHIHLAPPSPRKFNQEIPAWFEAIVLKCLEKEPSRRFANTTELLEAIMQQGAEEEEETLVAPASKVTAPTATLKAPVAESTTQITNAETSLAEPLPAPAVKKAEPVRMPVRKIPIAVIAAIVGIALVALLVGAIVFIQPTTGPASTILPPLINNQPIGFYFTANENGHSEVYRYVDGKTTRYTNTPSVVNNWSPVESQAGTLYFVSNRDGKAEIYKWYDNKVTRVTNTPDPWQSWSPAISNAGTLYFTSNRSGKAEIYKWYENETVQVTHTEGQWQSWSPAISDAGTLYFVSNRSGKPEIYKWFENQAVQVTHTDGPWQSWSPAISDAGTLYFTSNRSGKAEIYKWYQNEAIQVTHTEGTWESWSPIVIGQDVYFTSNRFGKLSIYLVQPVENTPPIVDKDGIWTGSLEERNPVPAG